MTQGAVATSSSDTTYPPSSAGPSRPRHATLQLDNIDSHGAWAHPAKTSYLVTTQTEDISDLRLQVAIERPSAPSKGSSSAIPVWSRQRQLSEQDEIVDRLVDIRSRTTAWAIHRPTRGWYIHLRSPALPLGFVIPLRPARPEVVTRQIGACDPANVPLEFALTTRVNREALARCHFCTSQAESGRRRQCRGEDREEFCAVDLSGSSGPLNGKVRSSSSSGGSSNTSSSRKTEFNGGHTAKTSSISATGYVHGRIPSDLHTRRKSASGTSAVDGLRHSSGTLSGATVQDVVVVEEQDASTPKAEAPPPVPPTRASRPRECRFVLTEGPAGTQDVSSQEDAAESTGTGHRLGWAKWAWGQIPDVLRPPLNFDTSKQFSILWTNAPTDDFIEASSSTSSAAQGSKANVPVDHRVSSDSDSQGNGIVEVLRYKDIGQEHWSLFNSRTRGRLILQEAAVEALGIDRSFWIAAGIAYLGFLEERDGYNAACDG